MLRKKILFRAEGTRSGILISALAGLSFAFTAPSNAWAQAAGGQTGTDAVQAQNGDSSAESAGALEEVVVTAERRTTNIQTTPISMEAVSGNTLESENQTRIVDLQLTTPSFTSANINGMYAAPNIRGIGNNQFNATNTPGVTVTKDGLYLQGIHDLGDPFYDVRDVEVL
ncbi:MAG TPA: TonB-dependent receptor plug domain-containing protein, partial [Steroidobacteraceae bacterium]